MSNAQTATTQIIKRKHVDDYSPTASMLVDDLQDIDDLGGLLLQAAHIVDKAEGQCDTSLAGRLRRAARQFLA